MTMVASNELGSDFSVILPTLNEGENIIPMIEAISKLHPASKIIIVDDNSTDGTPQKVQSSYPGSDRIRVIRRDPKDKGLTASIMDGILAADTKYYVVMDADFQHPPQTLGAMVASLRAGNDLVIGVREDKMSMRFSRKAASWGANFMAKTYLAAIRQQGSKDTMSGFFGGLTELSQKIIREKGMKFERRGFKALFDILKFAPRNISIGEVIFKFDARRAGESKLNSRIVLSIMKQCGLGGRLLAASSQFFLLSTVGRLLAAMILGLISTLIAITFTGDLSSKVFFNTVLALISAIFFVVLANELIARKSEADSILRGVMIVLVAFVGIVMNAYLSYALNNDLLTVAVLPSLLGLTVAISFDIIGTSMRRPTYAG